MSNIFSIKKLIDHRNRAINFFPQYDYLFEHVSNNIIDRLSLLPNSFTNIIRQICKANNIMFSSNIRYSESNYNIEYYIYF